MPDAMTRIAALNDHARQTFKDCRVIITAGVRALEDVDPTRQDVALMLQSFEGSARDLIDLIEETVMASKAVTL